MSGLTEPYVWLPNAKTETRVLARPGAGSTVDSGDVVAKDEHLAEALALLRDTPVNSLNTFQLKNCYRHLASFQRGRVIGAVEAQGRDCSGRTAGRRGVAV